MDAIKGLPTPRALPSVTSHDASCSSHTNPLFDLHGRGSLLAEEEDYDDVSRRYQAREQPSLPPFWHQEQQLHQQDGSSSFLSLSSSSTSEDTEYLRAAPELRCTASRTAARRPPALLVPEFDAECASADYGTTGSPGADTSGDQAGWQPEEDSWTAGVWGEAMQVSHCLVQSSCCVRSAAGSEEWEVEEAVWTPELGAEANQVAGAMAVETSLGAHSAAVSNASADMDVDFDVLEREAADVVSGWHMASMWFLSAVAALASADRAVEGVMAGLRRRYAAIMAWRGAEPTPAQPAEALAEVACCTPPPPPAATAAGDEAGSEGEGGDEDCGTAWGSPASRRCTSRCNSGARRSPSDWSAFCSRNGRADWAEHWEGWDEDVQTDGEEKETAAAMVARGAVADCTKLGAGRTALQWCDAVVHGCGLGGARVSALLESVSVAASG